MMTMRLSMGTRPATATPPGTAPSITTESLPGATLNEVYGFALQADGDAPITWELASGVLPEGVELLTDGTLSGVPLETGSFAFTVTATNSAGSDDAGLQLEVNE